MKAITVRRRSDRELVCFGPADGTYDPNFNRAVAVLATEPEYNAVLAEWQARPGLTKTEKDADMDAFLDSAGGKVMKALATVLVQKNVCTLSDIKAAYRAL